ncbi:hypothetical protein Mag101_13705 [Microbulbifer agarilyticus]|uniref:DUF2789 domain-containing protein n=1 Tax=Microbulbifer agarilyticus TaxID=260552 RepID=A0A1Q2M7P7_9GAMM|nr:DUF2789 domain-containing protein [Microbulbifer agarilyticus]AQQ68568.1 hypothetical protein Mag101_13705 [Microbulbifer agarilyticus]
MDTRGHHTLNDLFAQLGLGSDNDAIEDFLNSHHLAGEEKLTLATFWSDSQRKFLSDALDEDSDWCEVVDELDVMLRH